MPPSPSIAIAATTSSPPDAPPAAEKSTQESIAALQEACVALADRLAAQELQLLDIRTAHAQHQTKLYEGQTVGLRTTADIQAQVHRMRMQRNAWTALLAVLFALAVALSVSTSHAMATLRTPTALSPTTVTNPSQLDAAAMQQQQQQHVHKLATAEQTVQESVNTTQAAVKASQDQVAALEHENAAFVTRLNGFELQMMKNNNNLTEDVIAT